MGESHELETLIKKMWNNCLKIQWNDEKEILKTVMERIREKVPELRWVDADEGQLDFRTAGRLWHSHAAWWSSAIRERKTCRRHIPECSVYMFPWN